MLRATRLARHTLPDDDAHVADDNVVEHRAAMALNRIDSSLARRLAPSLSWLGLRAAPSATARAPRSSQRLTAVDSLRGLAALAVVGFHFTTKYDEVFGFDGNLPFHVPWGYLGVNLFFVISGFVIFMTLERTRRPLDFVVSRASRLYPAYWTAVALSFAITHLLGLPGKTQTWHIALLNIPMFQQLFGVPLVDGVYWTLLVELLFYALAFALFLAGWMDRAMAALCGLLALRLVYWGFAEFAHIDLPWRIRQVLVLDAIPFFALGIVAFHLVRNGNRLRPALAATAAFAIAVVAIVESTMLAAVALGCFLAVWWAAAGRLPLLQSRVLVWLGMISYPLYLLHENIGWALLRRLSMHGVQPIVAVSVTTVVVIALAAAVSKMVERPAMAWIRERYRRSVALKLEGAVP